LFFLFITIFCLTSCYPSWNEITIDKKISKNIVQGNGGSYYGLWLIKNYSENETMGLLVFSDPLIVLTDSNFVVAKNKSKYSIIELKNDSFKKIYRFRSQQKFQLLKAKLGVPVHLDFH
jgi:hypothetical protein